MTRDEILKRYPHASESFIRKNCTTPARGGEHNVDAGLSDTEQAQRPPALATKRKGKAQSAGCPCVRFTLCRVKLLDVDAKFSSVKDTLDFLAICGLIPGDKEGEITLEVSQVKVGTYAEEHTDVRIIYPKPEYATAIRDGYEVPLIGIPKSAEPSKGDFRDDPNPA